MLKVLIILIIFVFGPVYADVPAGQVKEVNHLLTYVKNSGCIINRNGTDHAAENALDHIIKKYDYFRDDIKSTEDFIELSATKKYQEWRLLHGYMLRQESDKNKRLVVGRIKKIPK